MTLKDYKPMKSKESTEKFYKYLWDILHTYREKRGIKVNALCEELEISRETFYWIVRNRHISLSTLMSILLKINADVIFKTKDRAFKIKYSTDENKMIKDLVSYIVNKGEEVILSREESIIDWCVKKEVTPSSVVRLVESKRPQLDMSLAFAKLVGLKVDLTVNGKNFKL